MRKSQQTKQTTRTGTLGTHMHGIMGSEHCYQPAWEGRKTNNRVGICVGGSEIDRSEIVSPHTHTHTHTHTSSSLSPRFTCCFTVNSCTRSARGALRPHLGMAGWQAHRYKVQGTVQANRHTGTQAGRHTGRQAHRHTGVNHRMYPTRAG
jgi:hypothetical protein